MRNPLLRILAALVIGVWSPLCCCQVTALIGTACRSIAEAPVAKAGCCSKCHEESKQRDGDHSNDPKGSPLSECPSCPSCQGTSSGAGLKAESTSPAIERACDTAAVIVAVVLHDQPRMGAMVRPILPSWWGDPPFVRANREALRWQCALIV